MASFNQMHPAEATEKDIRKALGSVDNEIIIAIQNTGASGEEVRQANAWLEEDDYIGAMLEKPMTHRVRRVYDILRDDVEKLDRYDR
ncbi:MAG: hypothetical protein ACAH83_19730 [Alphaproteobacteria bacterium]